MGAPSWTIGVHAPQGTAPEDLWSLVDATLDVQVRDSDLGLGRLGDGWFVTFRPTELTLDGYTAMMDVYADSYPQAAAAARALVTAVNDADDRWMLVTDVPEFGDLEDPAAALVAARDATAVA